MGEYVGRIYEEVKLRPPYIVESTIGFDDAASLLAPRQDGRVARSGVNVSLDPIAILAGGLGTRLGERARHVPKALAPVAGEPFVFHQLRLLARHGAGRVVMCVGHLGEQIEAAVGDGGRFGLDVRYSFDGPRLAGTAGAVRKALDLLGERFLVTYGDTYLRIDYEAVQATFHVELAPRADDRPRERRLLGTKQRRLRGRARHRLRQAHTTCRSALDRLWAARIRGERVYLGRGLRSRSGLPGGLPNRVGSAGTSPIAVSWRSAHRKALAETNRILGHGRLGPTWVD